MRIRNHVNPLKFQSLTLPKLTDIFPSYTGSMDVEIGFGRGAFLKQYGLSYPDRLLLGCEVRKQMVEMVEEKLKEAGIANSYPVHTSGILLLQALPDACVDRIFIFHPDPWFKTRHHKRRIVTDDLLKTAAQKLKPGGKLYLSTDVADLWDDMQAKVQKQPAFQPCEDPEFWSTDYKTHWQEFSHVDERDTHTDTFERIPT